MADGALALLGLLRRSEDAPYEDQLRIELVFPEPRAVTAVLEAARAATPQEEVTAEAAFGGDADRFVFVTYPKIAVSGQEGPAFDFARALRTAAGAEEANLVLRDSLYGASAAVHPEAFSLFGGFCSTTENWTYRKGWAHSPIATLGAWPMSKGAGVLVADIDTGRTDHQELAGVYDLAHERNFVEGGTNATDRLSTDVTFPTPGHGTLVSSVIASRGGLQPNFDTTAPGQITGVAPEATIVPIRAIRSVADINQARIPAAIAHAVSAGAQVIVMCLGGPTRVAAVEQALRDAVHAGVVVVCAAGNCWPFVVFPAAYSTERLAVAVAALTYELKPWAQSGRGPEVTVSAPGENVWGATVNGGDGDYPSRTAIKPSQGTTLATSLTAGVAALWLAHHGGADAVRAIAARRGVTVQELFMRAVVHDIAPPPVWDGSTALGAGVLNAERTLTAPIDGGAALVFEAKPAAQALSSLDILRRQMSGAGEAAAVELDEELRHYASELIWLRHQAAARERAAAHGARADLKALVTAMPQPSAGLRRQLVRRPRLAAEIQP